MKKNRHQQIIELVRNRKIETQEELAAVLNELGFKVTQATVSRDIKELKLSKVTDNNGHQFYRVIDSVLDADREKYIRVLRESLISMDTAGNLLVVKTMAGMANAAAAALDHFRFEKIVGTLAGDDTIMCALKNPEDAESVLQKLRELAGGN